MTAHTASGFPTNVGAGGEEVQDTHRSPLVQSPTFDQDFPFLAPAQLNTWFLDQVGANAELPDGASIKANIQSEILKAPFCTSPRDNALDNPPTPPQQARTITILCIDPVESCEPQGAVEVDGGYLNLKADKTDGGVNFTWDTEDFNRRRFRLGHVTLPRKGTIRLFKERLDVPALGLESADFFETLDGPTDATSKEFEPIHDPNAHCTEDAPSDEILAEGATARSASPIPAAKWKCWKRKPFVQEIMLFLDPFVILPQLKAIRLIKTSLATNPVDSTRVMALIKFQTFNSALTFYNHLNCQPFDVFEEAICYGIFVDAVQVNYRHANDIPARFYELPTCPICLVRLDGAVTGLRGEAVSEEVPLRWGLSTEANRCLVCWHAQHHSADGDALEVKGKIELACDICQSTEDRWSCLICGHLGCGRYKKAHARKHAEEKRHMLALELGTVRVWDYLGDCYVHRLVRNQADGQLVALPEAMVPTCSGADKLKKAVDGSEEISLLKMQLESQRILYQAQVDAGLKINQQLTSQLELTESEAHHHKIERDKLMAQLTAEEDKSSKLRSMIAQLEPLVKEDEAIFKHLLANLKEVRRHKADTLATIEDLSSQLQDVNFFLIAQSKIARELPELQRGTLELIPTDIPEPKKKGKRNRKKH
ncbi:hypothetical protein L0F63_001087 [Massospora cicadina]|nr:hypothetical protein L0F63_001087 [Massospora cicadina]